MSVPAQFRLPNLYWRTQLRSAAIIVPLCVMTAVCTVLTRSGLVALSSLLPLLVAAFSESRQGLPIEKVGLVLDTAGLRLCGRPIPYDLIVGISHRGAPRRIHDDAEGQPYVTKLWSLELRLGRAKRRVTVVRTLCTSHDLTCEPQDERGADIVQAIAEARLAWFVSRRTVPPREKLAEIARWLGRHPYTPLSWWQQGLAWEFFIVVALFAGLLAAFVAVELARALT